MRVLAVGAAACGFAAVSVVAKLAYEAGSSPRSLLAARLFVAGILLAPVAVARPRQPVDASAREQAAWAGLALTAGGVLEFEALSRLTAPTVVTLVFLTPVWVVLAGCVQGRRPPARVMCALPVLAAALFVFLGGAGHVKPDAVGIALASAASAYYALVFVLLERLLRRGPPGRTIAQTTGAAAIACIAIAPHGVVRELCVPETRPYALGVGAATAGSFLLLAAGMTTVPALEAALIATAEPIAAAVMSSVVAGETLTPVQVAAGLAVLASVTVVAAAAGEHA